MENKRGVSKRTKNNWLMDFSLFLTALVTVISGIYFLFIPSGGFQGGRNPWYGVRILFERETWEWLHAWIGVAMVVIALVHIIFHWKWVKGMVKRVFAGKSGQLNPRGRYNVTLNTVTALSFLVSAISGFYFLFAGSEQGGRNPDPMFLFTRGTWDAIHTWSSVIFIIAAILHFAIHWGWIVKVTKKVFRVSPEPAGNQIVNLEKNGAKEYTMVKKVIGIAMLVVVIGVLAFGALNRTSANRENSFASAEESLAGNGNGNGYGGSEVPSNEVPVLEDLAPQVQAPVEEHEDGYGYGVGEPLIETLPLGELSQAETDALLFMYEEEKMARDVYTSFAALYTQPMFANIASAEQTHMDSVKALLDRYALTVPVADTAGVFNNPDLQKLYNELTQSGSRSLTDALLAGAAIEEIDILDLKQRLPQTDQQDITQVFESLLAGSYNHLNAFSSVYAQETGVPYEPQYMDTEEWAEFQAYLAENSLYYSGNGRGRGAGGGGGGGRK